MVPSIGWLLIQSIVSGVSPATYPNPVTKGNLLLCRAGFENSGPITITDNAGNVWNSIQTASFGSPNVFWQQLLYAVANANFAGLTLTQAGGSPFFGMILTEFFGNAAAPLDVSNNFSGNATLLNGITLTTTKAGDLIYASFDNVNHDSVPQSPITPIVGSPHEGWFPVGPAGNYTPVATSALGGQYSEIAASFKHR